PPLLFQLPPATSHVHTLSLHDALPISGAGPSDGPLTRCRCSYRKSPPRWIRWPDPSTPAVVSTPSSNALDARSQTPREYRIQWLDRKSTRLNSSHVSISYAVFCLNKKH